MSNQTVREAAQAFLDEWGSGSGSLFDRIGDLKDALAQPDPEPTLCGMDEETLQALMADVRDAQKWASKNCHSLSEEALDHALKLIPVERKIWTVPETHCDKLDVSVVARSEWPKGVRIIIDSNGWDWMFYDIAIGVSQEIDITDPNNPFIVGEQS